MEDNCSSLLFGNTGHSVPETSCYTPNFQDYNADANFHPLAHPAYDNNNNNNNFSANPILPTYTNEDGAANELYLNSPYNSPNLSTEESENENDPFSQRSRIPVPDIIPLSRYHMWLETSFMCRRNERERQRVRNVNDGFSRLRNRLPRSANMRRRQSKVETLQHAIRYIKHLQDLLDEQKEKSGQK